MRTSSSSVSSALSPQCPVLCLPSSLRRCNFCLQQKIPAMFASPCFLAAFPLRPSRHHSPLVQQTRPHYHATQSRRTSLRMSAPGPNDLLIIGAGTLGRLIGAEWKQAFPTASIVGETRTEASHPLLVQAGISPAIAGSSSTQFPHVVFCVPPSAFVDYPAASATAATRVAPGGRLAFTSSTAVHGRGPLLITERTPVGTGPRALILAQAESNILAVPEGHVVRLGGLYTVDRGAHSFWLRRGSVSGPPDGMFNLVHYRDAAKAVVAILKGGPAVENAEKKDGRIYLASAGKSISRRGVCEAALKHPNFADFDPPNYEQEMSEPNRTFDNTWTRQTLGWKPEFESFDEFMEVDGQRFEREVGVGSR